MEFAGFLERAPSRAFLEMSAEEYQEDASIECPACVVVSLPESSGITAEPFKAVDEDDGPSHTLRWNGECTDNPGGWFILAKMAGGSLAVDACVAKAGGNLAAQQAVCEGAPEGVIQAAPDARTLPSALPRTPGGREGRASL
jgi:hypothetical protein